MTYVALPCFAPLNRNICKSVLGFQALTGSYETGKFFGFSKVTCRETYLASVPSIWKTFKRLEECLMVTLENC